MTVSYLPQSGRLTVYNVDAFLAPIITRKFSGDAAVTLDLRGLGFVDLFAMAAIACVCGDLHDAGVTTQLAVSEGGACGFLQRAGFFDILPQAVTLGADLPPARLAYMRAIRGANPALVEFTSINSGRAIRGILTIFRRVLRYQLRYTTAEAKTLSIMLSELCHNVLDHNADLPGAEGVAAMQVHLTDSGRFMQVVVADRGAGILRTLRRNERHADLASDVEAIEQCVELGMTEYRDLTHGNGLFHLLRLARQHHGAVHIRSGAGKVYYRTDRHERQRFTVPYLTGTQFAIVFPARVVPGLDV